MIGAIASLGLGDAMDFFKALPETAIQSAVYAINDVTSRTALPGIRRQMRLEVDFPSGYLEGDRLKQISKANKSNLRALIQGRDRPTSLARFAKGQTPASTRGRGVTLTVKPGVARKLDKSAFLIKLRNGNTGLAVRLKPGERPKGSNKVYPLGKNLFLLYGPSVDQVFQGVAISKSPEISAALSKQFFRQFDRLTSGK